MHTLNAAQNARHPRRGRSRGTSVALAASLFGLVGASLAAPSAYVGNLGSNSVSVIDQATGLVTQTIQVGTGPTGVAVSPDGARVYVANNGSGNVSVISTDTNSVVATVPTAGTSYGVAVTPDGSRIYVADHHAFTVSVISAATNQVVASIPMPVKPFHLAVTPDGSAVYATCADICNTLTKISTATNTVVGTTTVGTYPVGVDVSPDGSKVYVAHNVTQDVRVVSTATGDVVATIALNAPLGGVVVAPAGDKLYVGAAAPGGSGAGTLFTLSTATNAVVGSVGVGSVPIGLALTSDGKTAYIANRGDDTVSIVDTATQTVKAVVPVGNQPYSFGKFVQAQRYAFSGFFQPVDNLPTVNVMKAGAAVPVKFSLNGDQGLDIMAPGFPVSRQIACDQLTSISNIEETVTSGASKLSYDATTGRYSYVWKTESAWTNTCREFTMRLNDNSEQKARFRFSR